MLKDIYKITNKINHKSYIGQTNDTKRRFKEHIKMYHYEENVCLLYDAFLKYGIENFTFEIIEKNQENYNEREKYWIHYYNTNANNPNSWGYNLTDGGENPPVKYKENRHYCSHAEQNIKEIIELLKNSTLSSREIAQKYNYNPSSIARINSGKLWRYDNIIYPIRKEITKNFQIERSQQIKNDLLNSSLSQKEIAKKYNVARTMITAINRGQNYYDKNLDYPLRKKSTKLRPILMYDLNNNFIKEFESISQAVKELNLSNHSSISACLRGITATAYNYKWKYKNN